MQGAWIRMQEKSIQERLYWSVRLHGLAGTSLTLLSVFAKKIGIPLGKSKWYYQFLDKCFDRKAGTKTSCKVKVEDLCVSDELKPKLVEYSPSPAVVICMALSRLDAKGFSLVDLGCGKGKVIVLASLFPFTSIQGVERCPVLPQVASDNIAQNKLKKNSSR